MLSVTSGQRPWAEPRAGLLVRVEQLPYESPQGFWLRQAAENGLNPRWTCSKPRLGLHARVRFCSACLRHSSVWRRDWTSDGRFVCAEHGLWLVDRCDECRVELRWSNIRYLACPCGRGLQHIEQRRYDPEAWVMSKEVPNQVVNLLGTLSLFGLEDKPGKKASRHDVDSVAGRIEAGLAIAKDFPSASQLLLHRLRVAPPGSGVLQLLNDAFPGLKRRVEAVVDPEWRQRIGEGLTAFVDASQATLEPIAGRNTRPSAAMLKTVKDLASVERVRPERLAKVLDEMPAGTLARRVTAGGRVRRVVSSSRSGAVRDALVPAMSRRAAGRALGLSSRRVSVLRTAGLLACCTALGIDQLVARLRPSLKPRSSGNSWVPLLVAVRSLVPVAQTASFLRAAMEGRFALHRDALSGSSRPALAAWQISPQEVKAWVAKLVEGALSVPQLAIALKVKQEVAYHLVGSGLIKSASRRGASRTEQCITRTDVVTFQNRYQALCQLARRAGVGARGSVSWAARQGFRLAAGPSIDGCRQYFVDLGGSDATTYGPDTGELSGEEAEQVACRAARARSR